jgi:hypothetical protein
MSTEQIQVGPSGTLADGAVVTQRAGKLGDGIVSELQPRYYEQTARKQRFGGSIVGQVTTVGVATTYTGLCLSNPITSIVDLVLDKVGVAFLVAFAAAASVGIMKGYNAGANVTHTTPAVVVNKRVDGVAGTGLLDSAATLPTAPVLDTVLATGLTGAITTEADIPGGLYDMDGSIVLPPGGYLAIYTSTASAAASMSASLSWSEVPHQA